MRILYTSLDDAASAKIKQFSSIAELLVYVAKSQSDDNLSVDKLSIMPTKSFIRDDFDMGVYDNTANTLEQYAFPQLIGYCKIEDDISIEDYKRAILGALKDDSKYKGSEIKSVANKIQQGEDVFSASAVRDQPQVNLNRELGMMFKVIESELMHLSARSGSEEYNDGFDQARMTALNIIEDIFSGGARRRFYRQDSMEWYDEEGGFGF